MVFGEMRNKAQNISKKTIKIFFALTLAILSLCGSWVLVANALEGDPEITGIVTYEGNTVDDQFHVSVLKYNNSEHDGYFDNDSYTYTRDGSGAYEFNNLSNGLYILEVYGQSCFQPATHESCYMSGYYDRDGKSYNNLSDIPEEKYIEVYGDDNISVDISLTPAWEITFMSNYGDEDICSIMFVQKGMSYNDNYNYDSYNPCYQWREGHDFLGWFTEPVSGAEFDPDSVINSSQTYYAHWSEQLEISIQGTLTINEGLVSNISVYTEKYTNNGYSREQCFVGENNSYRCYGLENGSYAIYISTYSTNIASGYYGVSETRYKDAYTIPNNDLLTVSDNSTITKDINLTSAYILNFYININECGYSSGSRYNYTIPYGKSYNDEESYLSSPSCERFRFDGWYSEPVGGVLFDGSTIVNSDQNWYAHWTELPLTIQGTLSLEGEPKSGVSISIYKVDSNNYNQYIYSSTDNNGNYKFYGLEPGNYYLSIGSNGYEAPHYMSGYYGIDRIRYNDHRNIPDSQYISITDSSSILTLPTINLEPAWELRFNFECPSSEYQGHSSSEYIPKTGVSYNDTYPNGNIWSQCKGYSFDGWFTSSEGGVEFDKSATINGNQDYYPHWTALSRSIHGTVSLSNIAQQKVGVELKKVSATGSITRYASHSPSIGIDSDTTNTEGLYEFYVSYGSYIICLSSVSLLKADNYYTEGCYGSDGIRYGGEYDVPMDKYISVTSGDIEQNIDLTPAYRIIFNHNYTSQMTGHDYTPQTTKYIEATENATIGEIFVENVGRSGYSFDGWFTEPVGGEKLDSTTIINSNKTYYAHWVPLLSEIKGIVGLGGSPKSTVSLSAYKVTDDGSFNQYSIRENYGSGNTYSTSNDSGEYSIPVSEGKYVICVGSAVSAPYYIGGCYGANNNTRYERRDLVPKDQYFVVNSGQTTVNKNINLTNAHKISFNNNYMSNYSPGYVIATTGAALEIALNNIGEPIHRPGYIFMGWYTQAEGGELADPSMIISSDATYYAHWQTASTGVNGKIQPAEPGRVLALQKYDINNNSATAVCLSYSYGVGQRPSGDSNRQGEFSITGIKEGYYLLRDDEYGNSFNNTNSNIYGYSEGYYKNEYDCKYGSAPGGYFDKYGTRYVNWQDVPIENYIHFTGSDITIPDINTVEDSVQIVFYNGVKDTYTNVYDVASGTKWKDIKAANYMPVPTREGYTFDDWYTTKDDSGSKINDDDIITTLTKVYAHWTKNVAPLVTKHTVTFDSNGGSTVSNKEIEEGKTLGTLPEPIRDNYILKGWYTQPTGGVKISDTTTVTENVTYYAQWRSDNNSLPSIPINQLPEEERYIPKDIGKYNSEQKNAMMWVVYMGLSVDRVQQRYNPQNPVLRESMALFMYRMAGKPNPDEKYSKSLGSNEPIDIANLTSDQKQAIRWVIDNNISKPGSDKKFNPQNPVLRESMALFMYRMVGEPDKDLKYKNSGSLDASDFKGLTNQQRTAIRWMIDNNISKPGSDKKFNPNNRVIRESMALFLYRVFNSFYN